MKLNVAADIYVRRKRDEGLVYSWPAGYLAALCRQVGDVSLDQITSREIATFLEGPKTSPSTWLEKYHMLRGFFDFWLARGEIDVLPMPVKRKVSDRPFLPYIFTHAEIRLLLNGARNTRKVKRSKVDHTTLRTILIFLYGTGLRVGEALRLQEEDVDLKKGAISVHGNRFNRSRIIPIGPDLRKVLEAYAISRRKEMNDPYFFQDKAGERLSYTKLEQMFRRLRQKSEIRRRDDDGCYQPRMYDLRHTFATHRIAAWIKHGANLNRMLPALAIYMGLTDFRSTEKYLAFAPERFRAQLVKLSSQRGKKRWRDDPELMKFLSTLSDDSGKSRRLNGGTSIRVDPKSVAPTLPRHLQLRQRNDL